MATPTLLSYTSYTEVDTSAWLTLSSTLKATLENNNDSADSYAYYDGGASWVNDISLKIILYIASTSAGTGDTQAGTGFTVSAVNDVSGWGTSDIIASIQKRTSSVRILLGRGNYVVQAAFTAAMDTIYYCLLERAAASDTVTLKIYSDAARTNLLDTLTVTGYGTATRYQYHYASANRNMGAVNSDLDGYIDLSENIAGTVYEQAAAGTLTPAGALVKRDNKVVAGTLTPAGAITKVVYKFFAGTVTPAGALAKQTLRALAGTITPAGSIAKLTNKIVAGTLSFIGSLLGFEPFILLHARRRDRTLLTVARDVTLQPYKRDRILVVPEREDNI